MTAGFRALHVVALLVLFAWATLAGSWAPQPDKNGIRAGGDDWVMSVSCDSPPKVQLSLGPKNEVLGVVVKNAKIDGKQVLSGKGYDLGLSFEPHITPEPHYELSSPPLDLISLLKGGTAFEADVTGVTTPEKPIRLDLRGFGAAYDAACQHKAATSTVKVDRKGTLASTPAPSGWQLLLKHDCKGGEFIFEPSDARSKWDMSEIEADGRELSSDPMKTQFDGDLDGAIRFPYDDSWFKALKQARTLTVEVTDYNTTGGPKEARVTFDLRAFCSGK